MTTTLSHRCAIAASLIALVPLVSSAHDLVLVPETSGALTVKFGHPNDWQQADKERLLDLQVQGTDATARPLAPGLVGKEKNLEATGVGMAGKPALVTARYDNGLWVSMPGPAGKDAYFNTTKAMLPQGKNAMSAIKFAKALYATDDDTRVYRREVHHLIELIPQKNPASVKAGEKLPVLVKFAGKPLAGAGVEVTDSTTQTAEGQEKFTTNASGIAIVPIKQAGLNVISVDYNRKNDGSLGRAIKSLPVDKVAMIATYAFQVR